MFQKLPDDSFFEEMDPLMRLWLYESWYHEQELEAEKLKMQAVLIGSFFNPEAARNIIKRDNPDFETSDEEWEKLGNEIHEEAVRDLQKGGRRRKRRKVIRSS